LFFEALALITSVTNALGSVFIAKGMKDSTPVVASFYSVLIQAFVLTAILVTRFPHLNAVAISYFALGGVLSLGVGRLLNFSAMKGLGVAKTSALIGSSPVLTTLLSIGILSERSDISTILGAVTVTVGVVLISGATGFKIEKTLLIGITSALSYSLSNLASKTGVTLQPDAFLSATTGATAGFLFTAAYIVATKQTGSLRINRLSLSYFAACGLLSSAGWLTMMTALEIGSVSVVTTIVYSYPLFTLLFTRILIKDEKLTTRTILGSALIVAGVAAVTLL
jgi:drug/metabolite transporter (DMT)-like permease